MTTPEFLSLLAAKGIKIWIEADRLRYSAPKGVMTSALQQELRERKPEILALFGKAQTATAPTSIPLVPVLRDDRLPLSFAQQRIWFLHQLDSQTPFFNESFQFQITGALDVNALEQSVNEIIRRHEALRTSFFTVDGYAVQRVMPTLKISIPLLDLQGLKEAEIQQIVTQEVSRPFNLDTLPLLRVTLVRRGLETHLLILVIHHIIIDGWSIRLFMKELSAFYQAFTTGSPNRLPELTIQYADFAVWQRKWLTEAWQQQQLNYWKQQLAGIPPLLELPTDRPRPSIQTFRGSNQYFQLNQELTQKLKTLSQQSGATLFMTLLTAFAALLSRYTSQEDIVIGSLIANRNHSEIESLIGFFINALALRIQLQDNLTFVELLEQVRKTTLGAYAHQYLPFEKLVEELQPERSLSYTPLFQVMFILQNLPDGKLELPGLTVTPLEVEQVTANYDLTLTIYEMGAGLSGKLRYNTDLFDKSTITRLIEHFQTLLEGTVANPQQLVSQLPILSASERHLLLFKYNDTKAEYPLEKCFSYLFEAQVVRTPDAVAVVFENSALTYQQLNARANRWARHLIQIGVRSENIVAVLSDRNIDLLTAMLAVFKAGGAYLPLNPDHPVERIRQIVEQSQVAFVLSQDNFEPLVTSALSSIEGTALQVHYISQLEAQQHSSENLPVYPQSNNLAYVIYTSGSTGQPKGAMIEHRGMLNHLYAKVKDLGLSESDTVAQTAPVSFDISIWQFLVALLVGGKVYIVRDQIITDPAQLLSLVQRHSLILG